MVHDGLFVMLKGNPVQQLSQVGAASASVSDE